MTAFEKKLPEFQKVVTIRVRLKKGLAQQCNNQPATS